MVASSVSATNRSRPGRPVNLDSLPAVPRPGQPCRLSSGPMQLPSTTHGRDLVVVCVGAGGGGGIDGKARVGVRAYIQSQQQEEHVVVVVVCAVIGISRRRRAQHVIPYGGSVRLGGVPPTS